MSFRIGKSTLAAFLRIFPQAERLNAREDVCATASAALLIKGRFIGNEEVPNKGTRK